MLLPPILDHIARVGEVKIGEKSIFWFKKNYLNIVGLTYIVFASAGSVVNSEVPVMEGDLLAFQCTKPGEVFDHDYIDNRYNHDTWGQFHQHSIRAAFMHADSKSAKSLLNLTFFLRFLDLCA